MSATTLSSEHPRRARAARAGTGARILAAIGARGADDDGHAFLHIAAKDFRVGAVRHAEPHGHGLRIAVRSDTVDAPARALVPAGLRILAARAPPGRGFARALARRGGDGRPEAQSRVGNAQHVLALV